MNFFRFLPSFTGFMWSPFSSCTGLVASAELVCQSKNFIGRRRSMTGEWRHLWPRSREVPLSQGACKSLCKSYANQGQVEEAAAAATAVASSASSAGFPVRCQPDFCRSLPWRRRDSHWRIEWFRSDRILGSFLFLFLLKWIQCIQRIATALSIVSVTNLDDYGWHIVIDVAFINWVLFLS